MKENLLYHNFKTAIAGPNTTALITEDGNLLLHGLNDEAQLGFGKDWTEQFYFFPNFRRQDFFYDNQLKVLDVGLGYFHTLVLAEDNMG